MGERVRIVSWNVNGIRAAYRKGFGAWLEREAPDLVCLQETRVDPAVLSPAERAPRGYVAHWAQAERKGYSGVATLGREAPLHVETSLGLRALDREGRLVVSEHERFWLYNAYFPKGSGSARDNSRVPYKLAFYKALFRDARKRRRATGKPLVVVGDFNTAHRDIDLRHPGPNRRNSGFLPEERQVLDRLLKRDFVDSFRALHPQEVRYTWWGQRMGLRERNVGWRIDYVWLSPELVPHLEEAFISDHVPGSDHCPVGVILRF